MKFLPILIVLFISVGSVYFHLGDVKTNQNCNKYVALQNEEIALLKQENQLLKLQIKQLKK